jgi:hypothetical protein
MHLQQVHDKDLGAGPGEPNAEDIASMFPSSSSAPAGAAACITGALDLVSGLRCGAHCNRYRGAPGSPAAHEGFNRWVGLFAAACKRAVEHSQDFERRIAGLRESWRSRLGRIRATRR